MSRQPVQTCYKEGKKNISLYRRLFLICLLVYIPSSIEFFQSLERKRFWKLMLWSLIKTAYKKSSASIYIINNDFLSWERCCSILSPGWWSWSCQGHWCLLFWPSWYILPASLDTENLELILCYGSFICRTHDLFIMIEDIIKASLKPEWICHLVLFCFSF